MKNRRPYRDPPTDIAGYDPTRDAGDCVWNPPAAERVCEFFPTVLTHTKSFSGPFKLEPWQRDYIGTLFGWKRPDGTRRYRETFAGVPRKNGKTIMCAGLGLYCLRCDGELGPEVYCAAFSRDQATLVFDHAAAMARGKAEFLAEVDIHDSTKRIICRGNGGFMRAIPADAATSHGFNASAVIFDEVHTQTNRCLYDVLKTSQGARKQPLLAGISTAGHNRESICWELWQHARRVRDGIVRDPYFLPMLYEIGEGEAWDDRDVWRKVNPNLGVSISEEFLEGEYERASSVPAYENTFRNLYLNEWTQQSVRWLPMDRWDRCNGSSEIPSGSDCWVGVDLSTKLDITAAVAVFRAGETVELVCKFFVPAEQARERERRDRVPYEQWARAGWITTTPGNTIDYGWVRREINELGRRHHIVQIAMDRWNAEQLAQQLQSEDGLPVTYFPQTISNFTGPAKEFEKLVLSGELRHGGNPVLRWMADNVSVYRDANENIRPDKAHSSERIDGIVAAIMGIGSMMLTPATASGSLFVC